MDTQYDIVEYAKALCELFGAAAPNWLRMLAGASMESLSNPETWNALIEEVKAKMEQDNDSRKNPNQ